jgi:hypothetical protein
LSVAGVVLVSLQSWPVTGVVGATPLLIATVAGTQAEPFHSLITGGTVEVSTHCWPVVGEVGAVFVAVAGTGTQAEPFHTFIRGGVTLVSNQVVPEEGFKGALVPEGELLTGTHAVPFQTLRTGGVTPVSYQVAPWVGDVGGKVLDADGNVWPVAKLTIPPNVVVPSALRVPLATEEAGLRRLVTWSVLIAGEGVRLRGDIALWLVLPWGVGFAIANRSWAAPTPAIFSTKGISRRRDSADRLAIAKQNTPMALRHL